MRLARLISGLKRFSKYIIKIMVYVDRRYKFQLTNLKLFRRIVIFEVLQKQNGVFNMCLEIYNFYDFQSEKPSQ